MTVRLVMKVVDDKFFRISGDCPGWNWVYLLSSIPANYWGAIVMYELVPLTLFLCTQSAHAYLDTPRRL